MLYSEAKKQGAAVLKAAGIEDVEVDAEYLLLKAAGLNRSSLYMKLSDSMAEEAENEYSELINRRKEHEPLQYILGDQDFMGYIFKVTPDVLIPRFDTEILAEQAVKRAKAALKNEIGKVGESAAFRYLDLCTGSGCVAVSVGLEIAKNACRIKAAGPEMHKTDSGNSSCAPLSISVIGADISAAAVRLAGKNWEHNIELADIDERSCTIKAEFIESDLFLSIEGKFDMITANPPYIVRDEICTLMPEITEHEPHLALDGGTDGMDFYRKICKEAPKYLVPGGRLLMEFDDAQAEPVKKMMEEAGFKDVEIHKDWAGLRRVIEGTI